MSKTPATIKICTRCSAKGGEEVFYKLKNGCLMQPCRACCLSNPKAKEISKKWQQNNKNKCRISSDKWIQNNPDKVKAGQLRRDFGISLDKWKEMQTEQKGLCKICKQPPSGKTKMGQVLHVDHDHKTGRIRGLLCHFCNHLLGNSKDNIEILKEAIDYLENK